MYKQILLFLPKKTINEATSYYVDIIDDSLKLSGYIVHRSDNFKDVRKFKIVFVMSAKWCFLVKLVNPKAKIMTWFQGLGAEEALMSRGSKRDKLIWEHLEKFAIKNSWINIFVSRKMREHFLSKYRIKDGKYFIMPCFNKTLNKNSFDYPSKYSNVSFVYAGGMDEWQCIDETLHIYSEIESVLKDTHITLLTKEKEKAFTLLSKFNIKNSKVTFVSLDKLDQELAKYKYGFLIRKDHVVNNVSTPTKMNTYIANGVLPIYTDVINDFNENIESKTFVKLKNDEDINTWVEDIISKVKEECDSELAMSDIDLIFENYYNRVLYINNFQKILNS